MDLNSLIRQGSGYTILAGIGINDQGQVTTIARGPDGLDHYLYLTPNVPLSTILGTANDSPTTPPSSPPVRAGRSRAGSNLVSGARGSLRRGEASPGLSVKLTAEGPLTP